MRLARRFQRSVLVASLAAIAVAPPLEAQKRRPMTLIDLAELPRVIGPQLSPDGRAVAYFLSGADWKAGRLVFNQFPTGVEVGHAMVHGGPFPATSDGRSSSVGSRAIERFSRPVCFQSCPQEILPEELKDSNPRGLWRLVDGALTRDPLQTACS